MSFYEWLLLLHVLSAFLTVGAVVLFGALLVATRAPDVRGPVLRRLSRMADLLWNVGGTLVLVFGVWLALNVDGYELWDGWIIAALVLYAVASATGGMVNQAYKGAFSGADAEPDAGGALAVRTPRVVALNYATFVAILAVLAVMIYKPGA